MIGQTTSIITIDGSQGEGGRQIVRTALALSLVTGRPFRIEQIRARRKNHGLMRQHLTAVQAAAQVGQARLENATLGATMLTFHPGPVRPGQYHFAVGTAGSCTLVLQTVLPALMLAEGPSELVLEGGTHNPLAPPYDFLARSFLPLLDRMGPCVQPHLERPGFYPAGGGRMVVHITPTGRLARLDLPERGEIRRRIARAIVSKISEKIAQRELHVVRDRLGWGRECLVAEAVDNSPGPGNALMLTLESEHVIEVFTAFGERGVPAESVAVCAVAEVKDYLAAGVPIGTRLADQLLLPLALSAAGDPEGGGSFITLPPTQHTLTNIEVIRRFLDVTISTERQANNTWTIIVKR